MAEPRYQKYKDQGLQAWILLSEDANGDSPSLEYCKGIRDQYGLTMPVLIDPDGVLPGALGYAAPLNEWHFLLGEGDALLFKGKYPNQDQLDARIEEALGL